MKKPINLTVITLLLAVSNLSAATHYVSLESTNPTPPYTNWQIAARVIQDAVDAAAAGDQVVVTNGIYAQSGRAVAGRMTNRVAVDKPMTVRSVNGPQFTVIDGGGTNRCVSLTDGGSLTGFTVTNGVANYGNGGGVECASMNVFLTTCVIVGNSAYTGGGVFGGTLSNCALTGNSAANGGGGAAYCTLYNCTLTRNSAVVNLGGGASFCTLYNCTLTSNSAGPFYNGGGAGDSQLYNCTLSGNWGWFGGGVSGGTLCNCTLSGNSAYMGGGGVLQQSKQLRSGQ